MSGDPLERPARRELDVAHELRERRSRSDIRSYPLKRAFDVVVAVAIMILLLPLGIIIAGLITLGGGPVFYAAKRPGAKGRPFYMYKFRTMVPDADSILDKYLSSNPDARREYARNFKLEHDPRVTYIGRFLRKFSLDELPQLVNVVRGDMSLVGPRPRGFNEIAEAKRYNRRVFDAYYLCRPGMTGLWQVSGRSRTDYHTRIRMDALYVRRIGLNQDILILLKTVPVMLVGSDAF